MDDVKKELVSLMESLVRRMRLDLMSSTDDADDVEPTDGEGLARLRTAMHLSGSLIQKPCDLQLDRVYH